MTHSSSMPPWERFMVPVLEVLSDGQQRSRHELNRAIADHVDMPADQRAEVLNSGQSKADNRIGWALSMLTRAAAASRPRRAQYIITDTGHHLLAQHPNGITEKDLKDIPAFNDYIPLRAGSVHISTPGPVSPPGPIPVGGDAELDPVEQIDAGYMRLKAQVSAELLKRLQEQHPDFLELSVLHTLVAMGYGGVDKQARRIGGTGDGGVDGVIDQDKLGLQRIYVQAKRYASDNTVGREAIQAFVGALHGRNVSNGIFITTSRFSPGAIAYADTIGTRVILIDGTRLADLMIAYGIGVQTTNTYTVVELDEDYFE